MKKIIKVTLILGLLGVLVAIRFFEEFLFYDPLKEFFETDYLYDTLPNFNSIKLYASLSLRFFLNMVCSLMILWVAFKDYGIVKFATLIYFLAFLVLIIAFTIVEQTYTQESYLVFFYIRRFLIQPLLIILLLPAFYYHKQLEKK